MANPLKPKGQQCKNVLNKI